MEVSKSREYDSNDQTDQGYFVNANGTVEFPVDSPHLHTLAQAGSDGPTVNAEIRITANNIHPHELPALLGNHSVTRLVSNGTQRTEFPALVLGNDSEQDLVEPSRYQGQNRTSQSQTEMGRTSGTNVDRQDPRPKQIRRSPEGDRRDLPANKLAIIGLVALTGLILAGPAYEISTAHGVVDACSSNAGPVSFNANPGCYIDQFTKKVKNPAFYVGNNIISVLLRGE